MIFWSRVFSGAKRPGGFGRAASISPVARTAVNPPKPTRAYGCTVLPMTRLIARWSRSLIIYSLQLIIFTYKMNGVVQNDGNCSLLGLFSHKLKKIAEL